MSPPSYSGEAAATLVDESKYFQVKSHTQTVMMTVKGTIGGSQFNKVASDQFVCTSCPLCITKGGHTQPTAFTKLSTVDVSPWSGPTVLYTCTVCIADVQPSKSEGEDGEDEEQDLRDKFDDIYDDPDKSAKSGGGGGVNIEMDSPVQPLRHSKHAAAHRIQSSSNSTSDSSSTTSSCCRPSSKDTVTTDSSLLSWMSPESKKVMEPAVDEAPQDDEACQDNNAKKVVHDFAWI